MRYISTPAAPAAIGPYAQAVEHGGIVYVSGCLAIQPTISTLLDGGIRAQTAQALINLENILNAAGSGMSRVLKTTVYLTDLADFAVVNEVYAGHFEGHTPARSCVEVSRLPKDALVEIEAVAAVRE